MLPAAKTLHFASVLFLALLAGHLSSTLFRFYFENGFLWVKFNTDEASELHAFFDNGDGFQPDTMRRYTVQPGFFNSLILLPSNLRNLRIDPTISDQAISQVQIVLKAPGNFFKRQLHPQTLITANGKLLQKENLPSVTDWVPDKGTTDPQWILTADSLNSDDAVMPVPGWLLTAAFTVFFGASAFIGSTVFRMIRKRTASCRSPSKSRLGTISSDEFKSKPFIALLLFFTGSTLFLRYEQTRGYEISLRMQTEQPQILRVFPDFGSGFQFEQSAHKITSKKGREFRFRFRSQRTLLQIRIDPMEDEGWASIGQIRVRKGVGPWQLLRNESFEIQGATSVEPQDPRGWNLRSLSSDPRLECKILNPELIRNESKVYWIGIGVFVAILFGLLFSIGSVLWKHWIGAFHLDFGKRLLRLFPNAFRSGMVHPICMASVCFGWALVAFFAFFPGALCGDTAGNIKAAMDGTVSPYDPPLLQIAIRWLHTITINQWPLLAIQIGLYWFGFFLLGYFVWRTWRSLWCYLFCFLPLLPQLFAIHTIVIKDVLIAGLWLNILAFGLHLGQLKTPFVRILAVTTMFVFLVVSVLSRDNTFLAAPALLWITIRAWHREPPTKYSSPWSAQIVLYLIFVILTYGAMRAANGWMLGSTENRDYTNDFFIDQVAANDLIGISILRNHQGITATLDTREQIHLENSYQFRPIFWLGLETQRKLFPNGDVILPRWIESLFQHPIDYIAHRAHLFRHLFLPHAAGAMEWVLDAEDAYPVQQALGVHSEDLQMFERPPNFPGRTVFEWFRKWSWNHFERNAHWIFLFAFGIATFLPRPIANEKAPVTSNHQPPTPAHDSKELRRIRAVVKTAFLVAGLYSLPNLVFVQHAESRYVYPAVVLIFAVASLRWIDFWTSIRGIRNSSSSLPARNPLAPLSGDK